MTTDTVLSVSRPVRGTGLAAAGGLTLLPLPQVMQCPLDLYFTEDASFSVVGDFTGSLYLSGTLTMPNLFDQDEGEGDSGDDESDSAEEAEEAQQSNAGDKRKRALRASTPPHSIPLAQPSPPR